MTRRSITTVLGSLLVALLIATNGLSVAADDMGGGGGAPVIAAPQRECTDPTVGFPACYALQDDGTRAREESADTDAGWVSVGTATFDETQAAVGNVNAPAPGCPYWMGCSDWKLIEVNTIPLPIPSKADTETTTTVAFSS